VKDGLKANTVSSIYEDFEGDIWVATKGGGINKFRDGALTTFSESEGALQLNLNFSRIFIKQSGFIF
ncbi:MAG TPA: two-component regulator propeller domain-containing protein, partial [Ignavibacteriaceae bacterium]|nr:two-component regulator propeller domain-containing protein [Ignavibacteriaceae bacterium]